MYSHVNSRKIRSKGKIGFLGKRGNSGEIKSQKKEEKENINIENRE